MTNQCPGRDCGPTIQTGPPTAMRRDWKAAARGGVYALRANRFKKSGPASRHAASRSDACDYVLCDKSDGPRDSLRVRNYHRSAGRITNLPFLSNIRNRWLELERFMMFPQWHQSGAATFSEGDRSVRTRTKSESRRPQPAERRWTPDKPVFHGESALSEAWSVWCQPGGPPAGGGHGTDGPGLGPVPDAPGHCDAQLRAPCGPE